MMLAAIVMWIATGLMVAALFGGIAADRDRRDRDCK